MALWGKTDNLAGAPKFVARKATFDATAVDTTAETIDMTSASIGLSTGDAVVYNINGGTAIGGLTDGTTYYVRAVAAGSISLYDTQAHAIAGGATGKVNLTAAGTGRQILQRTGAANVLDHNFNGSAILFVDREESRVAANRAKGLRSPGWWLYKSWTNADGSVQHSAELLIAMDVTTAVSGDAEDTIVVDRTIVITAQPQDLSVVAGDNYEVTVTASVSPTAPLSYDWFRSTDGGLNWASTGITTATFDASNVPVEADGTMYRVVVSSTGATPVTSNEVTLTVTPVVITITVPPTDQAVVEPATATFGPITATTAPTGLPVTYQWQKQEAGSGVWEDIIGATESSYTTGVTSVADDNGDMYRVFVRNLYADNAVSDGVTLTVTA